MRSCEIAVAEFIARPIVAYQPRIDHGAEKSGRIQRSSETTLRGESPRSRFPWPHPKDSLTQQHANRKDRDLLHLPLRDNHALNLHMTRFKSRLRHSGRDSTDNERRVPPRATRETRVRGIEPVWLLIRKHTHEAGIHNLRVTAIKRASDRSVTYPHATCCDYWRGAVGDTSVAIQAMTFGSSRAEIRVLPSAVNLTSKNWSTWRARRRRARSSIDI